MRPVREELGKIWCGWIGMAHQTANELAEGPPNGKDGQEVLMRCGNEL